MEIPMEARIARLEADVAHLRTDVADIKLDLRARFDKVDSRMDRIDTKLDAVKDSIAGAKIWALDPLLRARGRNARHASARLRLDLTLVVPTADGVAQRSAARAGRSLPDSHDAFLRRRCDEPSVAREEAAEREAAAARRVRALHRVQQPVVDAERSMEPHRVVEARELHVALGEMDAVRHRGRHHELIVGHVREHVAVQVGIVGQACRSS